MIIVQDKIWTEKKCTKFFVSTYLQRVIVCACDSKRLKWDDNMNQKRQ